MRCSEESNLKGKCLDYLTQAGIYHIKIFGSAWCGKGAPDIIACINGKFVAFELKVGENNMQSDQRIHRVRICRNGGLHYCPRTIDEFVSIIQEIQGGRNDK